MTIRAGQKILGFLTPPKFYTFVQLFHIGDSKLENGYTKGQ